MKTQVLQIVRALSLLVAIFPILVLVQQVGAHRNRQRGQHSEQPNSKSDNERAKNAARSFANRLPVAGQAPMMQQMRFVYAPVMYPAQGMLIPAYPYANFEDQPNKQPTQQAKNYRRRNRHQKTMKRPFKGQKLEQNSGQPQSTPEQQANVPQTREDLEKKLAEMNLQILEANELLSKSKDAFDELKQRLIESEAEAAICKRKSPVNPIATDEVTRGSGKYELQAASANSTHDEASMATDGHDASIGESTPEVHEAQTGVDLAKGTKIADEPASAPPEDARNLIDSATQHQEKQDPFNLQLHDRMDIADEPGKHDTPQMEQSPTQNDVNEHDSQHDIGADLPVQYVVEDHEDTETVLPILESPVEPIVRPTGPLDEIPESSEKQQGSMELSGYKEGVKIGLDVEPKSEVKSQAEPINASDVLGEGEGSPVQHLSAGVPHRSVETESSITAPGSAEKVNSSVADIAHEPVLETTGADVMMPFTDQSAQQVILDKAEPTESLDGPSKTPERQQASAESWDHERAVKNRLEFMPKAEVEGHSESVDVPHVPGEAEEPIAAPELPVEAHNENEALPKTIASPMEEIVEPKGFLNEPIESHADPGYLEGVKALKNRIEQRLKIKSEQQSDSPTDPNGSDEAVVPSVALYAPLAADSAPEMVALVSPGDPMTNLAPEIGTNEPTVVIAPTEPAPRSAPSAAAEPIGPMPAQQASSFDPITARVRDVNTDAPTASESPKLTRSQSISEHRIGSATPSLGRSISSNADSRGHPTAPKVSAPPAGGEKDSGRRAKKGFRQSLLHGMDLLRQKTKKFENSPFVHDTIAKIKNHANPLVQNGYHKAQETMDLLRGGVDDLRRLGKSAEAPARLAIPTKSEPMSSSGAVEREPTGTKLPSALTLPYQSVLPDRLGAYPLLPRTGRHPGRRVEVEESHESSFSNDGSVKKLRRSMSNDSFFSERTRFMRH